MLTCSSPTLSRRLLSTHSRTASGRVTAGRWATGTSGGSGGADSGGGTGIASTRKRGKGAPSYAGGVLHPQPNEASNGTDNSRRLRTAFPQAQCGHGPIELGG